MRLHDCTCPNPCFYCPPLMSDAEADAERVAFARLLHPSSFAPSQDPHGSPAATPWGVSPAPGAFSPHTRN